MKALITKIITTIGLSSLLLLPTLALVPGVASAQSNINNKICQGVLTTTDTPPAGDVNASECNEESGKGFTSIVQTIINVFSLVVGAISVIMIIIGGFRYIISNGDSGGVSGAKNTILYAIVGLVIVLFAQVIVRFVLTNIASN